MAAPSTTSDYFSGRPSARTRPTASTLQARGGGAGSVTPRSPRTPLLGRSISSQFGSPGSFIREQEDYIVYELGARHLSAGFAGESRPRVILGFDPESGRRVGDYRSWDAVYSSSRKAGRKGREDEDWEREYDLYRLDLRGLDLGLVEDKLERAVRKIHSEHLQLDTKTARKAILALPSLLPTPLVKVMLKVLFAHHSQPPSIQLLTTPALACVAAGLRDALVVEVGWEETVVTAVGEYKEVLQRRSVRAGRMLVREMAGLLDEQLAKAKGVEQLSKDEQVSFAFAEEVTQRLAWCRSRTPAFTDTPDLETDITIPLPPPTSPSHLKLPFTALSLPTDHVLFPTSPDAATDSHADDHDLPLAHLLFRALLALPTDLRAGCLRRIVLTGGLSALPGLKPRLLQELQRLIDTRGWDPVRSYGSATSKRQQVLRERSANLSSRTLADIAKGSKPAVQQDLPARERVHDDVFDPVSLKAERRAGRKAEAKGERVEVRGVETLGAWAGASLMGSLRVKGVREVEREEFGRYGFRDGGVVV